MDAKDAEIAALREELRMLADWIWYLWNGPLHAQFPTPPEQPEADIERVVRTRATHGGIEITRLFVV